MMNLFQLQEQLKDFSKEQLVREMQSPSGNAPPFLVMTELQRRTRMENAAALDKGPPTSTVAQDAVNAAGVPQGGIADMARSLAPQTNMAQNTGALTPQAGAMPQGAAPVQAMQEGGLLGDPLNTYAQYLDQTYSNPKIESFVSEVKGLEEDTFGQPPFGGQTPFGGTQGGGSYGTQTPPGPPPSSGMSQLGAMMGQNPVGMRSLVASGNPMASVLNGGSGAPGIRNDNNAAGNPLSTRHNLNAMVLPSVKRMQEGGLAGISRNVRDFRVENDPAVVAMARRLDMTPEDYLASLDPEVRATQEQRVSRNQMQSFDPLGDGMTFPSQEDLDLRAAEGPVTSEMLTERGIARGGVNPSSRERDTVPTYYEEPAVNETMSRGVSGISTPGQSAPYRLADLPGTAEDYAESLSALAEGRAEVPSPRSRSAGDLSDLIDVSDTTFAAPASAEKPARVPDYYNLAAMDMAMDRRIGGDQPQAPLLDGPSAYRSMDEMTAPSARDTPGESMSMDDFLRAAQSGGGFTEADIAAAVKSGELEPERVPDVFAMLDGYSPSAADLLAMNAPGRPDQPSAPLIIPGPLPGAVGDYFAGITGATNAEIAARQADRARDRQVVQEMTQPGAPDTSPTLTPTEDLTRMTGEDLLPAAPTPEVLTPQAPTGPTGGGATSGATVGGMPVPPPQSAEDRMLQQDKWLALARFGAALASSQAPTFGQALGQAGQVGLDALSKARQDFLARKKDADAMAMQRAALAARTAGGGGDGALPKVPIGAVGIFDDQIEALQNELMGADPAREVEITNELDRLFGLRNAIQAQFLAAYNPELALASLGGGTQPPPTIDVAGEDEMSVWDRIRGAVGISD